MANAARGIAHRRTRKWASPHAAFGGLAAGSIKFWLLVNCFLQKSIVNQKNSLIFAA
jgi:hypothetical protein